MTSPPSLHRLFFVALTLFLLAAPQAWAVPNVQFLDVQPRVLGVAQAAALAPESGSADQTFEIALDVTVRNDEPAPVFLQQVNYSFGVGFDPPAAVLTTTINMQCGAGGVTALPLDNRIDPGETCRILLIDDVRIKPWVPQFVSLLFFFQNESPLQLQVPVVVYSNTQPGGAYEFFGSAHDLAPGEFWSTRYSGTFSRHRSKADERYAYDAGLVRFDKDSGTWTNLHPLSPGEIDNDDENEDFLVWGVPVYAMADGVVANCRDGMADNVPGVTGGASNSFIIDHGTETASYLHFREGTLNPLLCMAGAMVQAGDYLGEVGNSGFSTAPHLHVDVTRNGQGFPINFKDVFIADRTTFYGSEPTSNADWSFVDSQAMPWEGLVIWPTPIVRRGTESEGKGSDPAILDHSADVKVMGAINAQGRLELSIYDRLGDGELSQTGHVVGETIQALDLAKPSLVPFFVSAVIDANGVIHLTEWDVSMNEGVSVYGGLASDLAIATSPHMPGLVTASRNHAGQLRVMGWDYTWGASISVGDIVHGPHVTQVAIATGDAFDGVVTASRTNAGKLTLSSWSVNADESLIVAMDTVFDIGVQQVEITHLGQSGGADHFMTAVRNDIGRLQVMTWSVTPGGVITRLDDAIGGKALDVDVADGGDSHAMTAVRDHVSGDLEIAAWMVDAAGQITLRSTTPGPGIREVAVADTMLVNPTTREQFVTAIRDDGNRMHIVSWESGLEQ